MDSSAPRPYAAKPLDDSTSNVRLIELLPGNTSDLIECRFHVFPVTDCLNFIALSYTWGPVQPRYEILLDGQPFSIRKNLWDALRAIRSPLQNTIPEETIEAENVERGISRETASKGDDREDKLSHETISEDDDPELPQPHLRAPRSTSQKAAFPSQIEPTVDCRTCLNRAERKKRGLPVWPELTCVRCGRREQVIDERNKKRSRMASDESETTKQESYNPSSELTRPQLARLVTRAWLRGSKETKRTVQIDWTNKRNGELYWVDQICVDQNKISERNHQVSLMKEIYARATTVLVWLGASELLPDIETEAVEFIRKPSWKDPTARAKMGYLDLCKRSYWKRMWIVQEIMLAQRVQVQSGQHTFFFEQFLRSKERLERQAGRDSSVRAMEESPAWRIIGMKDRLTTHAVDGHRVTLRMLVHLCREQESTDVRDKIFGLLSLLSAEDDEDYVFQADYSKTPEEVCSMAVALAKKEERLPSRKAHDLHAELRTAMRLGPIIASTSSSGILDRSTKRPQTQPQQGFWRWMLGGWWI
jgi:hypothetical protein